MQKSLVTKSQFARTAGVNPSTVTRVWGTTLAAAVVGDKIDQAHPDAVAYVEKRQKATEPPKVEGLDPRHEEIVQLCRDNQNFTPSFVQRNARIGYERAKRVVASMAALGIGPEPDAPPRPRGQEVVRQKKREKIAADRRTAAERPRELHIPAEIEEFLGWTLLDIIEKFGSDSSFVEYLNATQKIEMVNEKRLKNAKTKGELIDRKLVKTQFVDEFNATHLRLLKDGAKTITAGVIAKSASGANEPEIEEYVSDVIGSFISPTKDKIGRALQRVGL